MLLPPPCEGHPILHVLEEVCLLDREVLVHYLEKLAVSEDVWSADLEKNCHFQTIQEARIEHRTGLQYSYCIIFKKPNTNIQ